MARYGRGGGCASRGHGGRPAGGFTNHRTGTYVSSTRAHQHTGQNIGGYTKVRSQTSGNYYMRKE